MTRTLYIHMGQPKTGTTSLQHFCSRNRQELKERFDLCYPTAPSGTQRLNKHKYLFPFRQRPWQDAHTEAQASGCSRVLVSSEHLAMTGISDSDLYKIRECFVGYTVFFVVYLRRIDDYCRSYYKQSLKMGRIQDYYAGFVKAQEKWDLCLHPSQLLERCERQVGREQLLVRIYDPVLLKYHSTVDDFFELLGIELPLNMSRPKSNRSLPDAMLPYITPSLRKALPFDPVAGELRGKLRHAFTVVGGEAPVDASLVKRLEEEVAAMGAYVPEYRQLYAERGFDLSPPDMTADPYNLLMLDLMYNILFELRRRERFAFRIRRLVNSALQPVAAKLMAIFSSLSRLLQRK